MCLRAKDVRISPNTTLILSLKTLALASLRELRTPDWSGLLLGGNMYIYMIVSASDRHSDRQIDTVASAAVGTLFFGTYWSSECVLRVCP